MIELPPNITTAVENFGKLPGVGSKTALRQVMSMTNWDHEKLDEFSQAIALLKDLRHCNECGVFCETELCNICSNPRRIENKYICVVENISDLMAIEKSEDFRGLFHILGGVLNPLAGIGPEQLRIDKLMKRIDEQEIESVILAMNPSVEGDATCSFLNDLLRQKKINVERIGFGIPIGGSLEFLDPLTIARALENRKLL